MEPMAHVEEIHDPVRAPAAPDARRFPLWGLLALAMAAFITLLTETLPAGVLPAMARDLDASVSAAGQTVTLYAIASVLTAVPLVKMTAEWPRRRLLLTAVCGFIVANTITALSTSFALTLVSRFLAGTASALIWALLAGYARRMVEPHQRGRALAIASAGTPVALAIGVPAGAFFAQTLGWRVSFAGISILTVLLALWILLSVPQFPGQKRGERQPLSGALRMPGVLPVLGAVAAYVLAHSVLYNYIAPFLGSVGLGERVDAVLLAFGGASILGLWLVGTLIDRHLRTLVIASSCLFALAAVVLGLFAQFPVFVFIGAALWGFAFGGVATLLQTAAAEAAGSAVDMVQSLFVTAWNLAIAAGGVIGGILLAGAGPEVLPGATLVIAVPAILTSVLACRNAFPGRTDRQRREAAS